MSVGNNAVSGILRIQTSCPQTLDRTVCMTDFMRHKLDRSTDKQYINTAFAVIVLNIAPAVMCLGLKLLARYLKGKQTNNCTFGTDESFFSSRFGHIVGKVAL